MSSTPAATPPTPPPSMTSEQLQAMIAETAKESVGPAVKAALEPLTKSQGDVFERLMKALPPRPEDVASVGFDDKTLGAFPYGRKVRALAMGMLAGHPNDPDAAALAIKQSPGWPASVAEPTLKWLTHVKTTLTAGSSTSAGALVLPSYDPDWIPMLRNNGVVRSIARTVPMPRGATTRRKQTGSAVAYYVPELGPMIPSSPSIAAINLSYKKLTALCVVSNDLIRFTAGEADRFVQEDMLQVVGLREDRAFLVGNPPTDPGSPQGIRYQAAPANIFATSGTSLANFQADLTRLISTVQTTNIPSNPSNSYFIMSPATFWTIFALTTTTGDWVFSPGLTGDTPRILGYPVKLTSQLAVNNSWIGANGGMVFFVYAPALEIHDSMQRTIATYVGGAYWDPTLNAVASGISNDETVITCIAEHDFLVVYDQAVAIVTGLAT